MKILVTGATGYIGSNFINIFKNKHELIQFSLQTQKLEDVDFKKINAVLHCAAMVHQEVEHSYEEYVEINIEYPLKLATLAKEHGVKQFVFISTIAVYGDDHEYLDENTKCNPVTPYGKSKLAAEKKLLNLSNERFTVSIIRPPMVYGKDAPGNIDALVKLVKRVPILPFGSILNKRSFVFIGNLCHLIGMVLEQEASGIFLASDDEPLSTSRLIELIAKALNKKVTLVKLPFFESLLKILKPSFHKRLYGSLELDNTLTKQKLNLQNPYIIDQGITRIIQGTA